MRLPVALAFAAILSFGAFAPAIADDTPAQASDVPWIKDQSLTNDAVNAVRNGGILALEPFVPNLEAALSNAKQTMDAASGPGGKIVFTDGPADSLLALMDASTAGKSAQAVPNPYPIIALYLGSYYNESGEPNQALRVLDEGLAVTSNVGAHRPVLYSERGAALEGLHRWQDALDDYNEGLKINGLDPQIHALLLRGRGFTLTELGQLDDAEAAYNESLKYAPGNERAEHEIQYIDQLRMGGGKAPAGIIPVEPKQTPPADAAPPTPAPSSATP